MAKIVNWTYITMEGVVDEPHKWPSLGRPGDDRATQIVTDVLLGCDAVLMGRRTYDVFAPVWPTRSGDPYSDHINTMPKYVVSTTLTDPEWANTTVIGSDVAGAITKLKQSTENDIVQYGIGPVTRLMLEHELLDELHLWVHPFVLGAVGGEPPFAGAPATAFEPLDQTALSDGNVILSYRVERRLDRETESSV